MDQRISAYLTTFNCWSAGYPVEAAVESVARFCFEVIVADGGSNDGTWERLQEMARRQPRLKLLRYPVDTTRTNWALDVDLWLKAKARQACSGDYCWQADADEVVVPEDGRKVEYCLEFLNEATPLLALPLLEYWGGTHFVRRDIYPATLKLSLNRPNITHGLPRGFRAHDEHGLLYALPYAELGSTYVDTETDELVSCDSMIPDDIDSLRDHPDRADYYESLFYECIDDLPVVHHFAWLSIEGRLRRLRDFWADFHRSFYHIRGPISAWPLFEKDWNEVTDGELTGRARELEKQGPGEISGADGPTLMVAKKELPADVRRALLGSPRPAMAC